MELPGRKKRRRPQWRFKDVVEEDMLSVAVGAGDSLR